ncbi:hypothetical protein IW262DRAFT_1301751 [Armillaria fumosa]|nr:hypothetical protein IW262DRAFT_1301751 [Armillaria fumosa]
MTAVNNYFRQFFWALPLNQDPHDDDPPSITDDELSSAQYEVKAAVVKQMGNVILKWLEYHTGKVTPVEAMLKKAQECDPILAFLSHLAEVDVSHYCSLTAKQLFGEQNEDISTCFNIFWNKQEGLAKDWVAACTAFMASKFEKLSTEDQDRWAAFAERTSVERKRTKDGGLDRASITATQENSKVKDMQCHLLRDCYRPDDLEYTDTGYANTDKYYGISQCLILGKSHISLAIAGPEPQRGGQVNVIKILSEGTLASMKVLTSLPCLYAFTRLEKSHMAAIEEFALSCYTPKEQKAHALPGVAQPPGPPPFWMTNTLWQSSSLATVGSDAERWEAAVDGDDEDQSEDESETKGKKKKKKKASKKQAHKSLATEADKGVYTSKRRKGINEETLTQVSPSQVSPSIIIVLAARMRINGHEALPNIMNTAATIHPVMEDDANSIDPSLLTTGLYPSSLISNCGPNDCPNPFSSQSDATPQNTFIERIVEVSPSARDS